MKYTVTFYHAVTGQKVWDGIEFTDALKAMNWIYEFTQRHPNARARVTTDEAAA